MSTQPYVQSGEPLNDFLRSFWQRQIDAAEQETPDYRHPPLPLARIKKVMKSDPDVKMIAADVFISEITARAFIVADANKRRTLSRSDIAKALSKSDQFDFLIDIVPRDDIPFGPGKKANSSTGTKQVSFSEVISFNLAHELINEDKRNTSWRVNIWCDTVGQCQWGYKWRFPSA
ncbi:hypothetical protein C0989_000987 [Termitomyces sp. Mn162]|nr:hypothetical protein C0989_000987 [Termitomyces sp. Mn162]